MDFTSETNFNITKELDLRNLMEIGKDVSVTFQKIGDGLGFLGEINIADIGDEKIKIITKTCQIPGNVSFCCQR